MYRRGSLIKKGGSVVCNMSKRVEVGAIPRNYSLIQPLLETRRFGNIITKNAVTGTKIMTGGRRGTTI